MISPMKSSAETPKGSPQALTWVDQVTGKRVMSLYNATLLAVSMLCAGVGTGIGINEMQRASGDRQMKQDAATAFLQKLAELRTQWMQVIADPNMLPPEKVHKLSEHLKALEELLNVLNVQFGAPQEVLEERKNDLEAIRKAIRQILIENPLLMENMPPLV